MAKSYLDGCICGKLPVNRSDINPDCPLHGALLAIWPSDDSAVNASLTDPKILNRVTDTKWLRRAADYLEKPIVHDNNENLYCLCGNSPPKKRTDIHPLCPIHRGLLIGWPMHDLGAEIMEINIGEESVGEKDVLQMPEVTPEWVEAWEAIDRRVKRACRSTGLRCLVIYSAYPQSDDVYGVPIDNLDVIATPHRIVLTYYPSNFGNGRRYISPILNGPTWMDLVVCANAAIHTTQSGDHVFFEDIVELNPVLEFNHLPSIAKMERLNVDRIYSLVMGS